MNHKHPSLSSSYAPYEYMYVDNRCYFSIYIPSTGRSCWWSASPSIKQQKVNLFRPVEPLFTVTPGQSYLIDCINELTLVVAATNIKFKSASQCVMSSEFFFIIISLYSVRLKKLWMDKIKLLWWHLHEISENWAGRNNIAAWCVNSQLITNAGNLKFTATNSFNYPIINSLIESLGIRLTWLDCVQSPYWRKRFQAPDKTFRTHKLPIPSLNLYQVMWFDVFSRDLYCESRDETSGTPVTSSPRSAGTFWLVIHGKNHVTKCRTTSLGKDSRDGIGNLCVLKVLSGVWNLVYVIYKLLFERSELLKETLIWTCRKCFFFFTFILLDPQKSNKKGKVPRKMLQTQVRPGLSVLAKLIFIYSIILLFARLLVIGRNL